MKSAPVLLLLTLNACVTDGEDGGVKIDLAAVPADIRGCFYVVTGKPMPGAMDARQISELVLRLHRSEVKKNACGRRLLALYDAQSGKDF